MPIRLLCCVSCAVGGGGEADGFAECPRKIVDVGESQSFGDFRDVEVGIDEVIAG